MEMKGQQRIEASKARTWAALNDPEILRRCIPGCKTLDKTSDTEMKATAGVKVGPIGANFSGTVTLSDLDPPHGYRIAGEGSGGAAGFAKGGATVKLREDGPDATLLDYAVSAEVGGKLAQLGGPIIDATAKQMAAQFFRKLAKAMNEPELQAAAAPVDAGSPAAGANPAAAPPTISSAAAPIVHGTPGASALAWGLAVLCAALLGFVLGRSASGWDNAGAWPGLALGLAFVVVAGAGFALGKGSAR